MKSTSLSTKLITVFLLLAVAVYFGVQGYRYLVNPTSTTLTYRYRTEDTLTLKGFVVRDETVIVSDEPLLELTHAEGTRVAAGAPLAVSYRSEDALEKAQELEALRAQLEQLQYAQSAASDTETALRLDTDIRSDIVALRAAYADGSYASVDSLAAELKTTVLKREYAYSSTDLSARVESLTARISADAAAIRGTSKTIPAPFAGTYSAVVDGYESVLTSAALETMTTAEFEALSPQPVSSSVGKLIEGSVWRFAAVVSESDAAALTVGHSYALRMASGVDFDLPVRVERIGRVENRRCLLILSGTEYLSYVTLLREQNAELILDSFEGLRIPKNALRVDENGAPGVYCLVGLTAYFKPVDVLYQGEDYCLVTPGEIDSTSPSTIQLLTLRASDEVIISAGELYNGKVVSGT